MRLTSGMPKRPRLHLRGRVAKKMRELGVRKNTRLTALEPKWLRLMMMMMVVMMMMMMVMMVVVVVMMGPSHGSCGGDGDDDDGGR